VKRHLVWRQVSRDELAAHLQTNAVLASEANGEATLYRCEDSNGETVAIALPGEHGVIIEIQLEVSPALERRRRKPV
jgi:hypothetical protein